MRWRDRGSRRPSRETRGALGRVSAVWRAPRLVVAQCLGWLASMVSTSRTGLVVMAPLRTAGFKAPERTARQVLAVGARHRPEELPAQPPHHLRQASNDSTAPSPTAGPTPGTTNQNPSDERPRPPGSTSTITTDPLRHRRPTTHHPADQRPWTSHLVDAVPGAVEADSGEEFGGVGAWRRPRPGRRWVRSCRCRPRRGPGLRRPCTDCLAMPEDLPD